MSVEVDDAVAALVAAVNTVLYSIEDTVDEVAARALQHTDNVLGGVAEALSPAVGRAYVAADVNLPGDDDDGPLDWTLVERVTADTEARLQSVEQANAEVADRALAQTNVAIDAILPSSVDVLSALVKVISDLVSGLVGSLTDAPELWESLYATIGGGLFRDMPAVQGGLSEIANAVLSHLGESLSGAVPGIGVTGRVLDTQASNADVSPEEMARNVGNWPAWAKSMSDALMNMLAAKAVLEAQLAPIVSRAAQVAMSRLPVTPLGSAELAELVRRNDVQRDWATEHARRSGVSPELFDLKYLLTQRFLPPDQLLDLWRRTGDDGVLGDLYRQGFATQDVERLRVLALSEATPPDVVRFMARDVTDPAAIAFGQLDADFAKKYDKALFDKAGVSQELAKLYWMAHWSLPSPTMGYSMLHRGIITQAELEELLKLADYAPGWVSKMMAISYNVPGRIDVRRMWETGIITQRPDLVRRYEDMGYSPADADTLASFTEALVKKQKDADAARTRGPVANEIVRSFLVGTISREDAHSALVSVGFTDGAADERLRAGEYGRERDRADRVRDAIGKQYVRGFLDKTGATSALSSRGFHDAEILNMLESWDLDRELREETEEQRHAKDLTKSELLHSYSERLIDRSSATSGLQALGYDAQEAQALVRLEEIKQQKADAKVVESSVHAQYIARRISAQEAGDTLLGFGYTHERVAALMSRWEVEQEERRPDLSNAQLERLLMRGLAPPEELRSELQRRGYSDRDVTWLMNLWGSDLALTDAQLQEKIREFDIREERQTEQGRRRLDISEATLQQRGQQFQQTATAVQQRFEASQDQSRSLQQQRLDAQSARQATSIAAQTARDAAAFAARRETQATQLEAVAGRLASQIAAQDKRQQAALADAEKSRQLRATLQQQASQAADTRQVRQLEAQSRRQDAQIQAANARAEQAASDKRVLSDMAAKHASDLAELRGQIIEARDIRLAADRIATEGRQEQAKVRTETRAQARRDITSATAAANASLLQGLQLQQASAIADINARFAALQATVAQQRAQQALDLKLAAQQALSSATPASALLETHGF